jgi:hypothetical protein
MITNKQRDIYKHVKSNEKIDKLSIFSGEDLKLAEELENQEYLEKTTDSNNVIYFKLTETPLPRKQRETAYKKLMVNNINIPIKRCEKPKFGGRGRKWEFKQHIIEGTDGKIYLDINWGSYMYLSAPDNRWYKIEIDPIHEYLDIHVEQRIKTIANLTESINLDCVFKY